jgi:hypothetical protein
MPAQIFNRIYKLLFFWRPKKKSNTEIPDWILSKRKSIHHAEKNAANKIYSFSSVMDISNSEVIELFEAELRYENEKYRIQHDFPHMGSILKEDIQKAKEIKYNHLKTVLEAEVYDKYIEARIKSKNKEKI